MSTTIRDESPHPLESANMLATTHNIEVIGRNLCHKLNRTEWDPAWPIEVAETIQFPAMVALPWSLAHQVTEARVRIGGFFDRCESPLEEVFLMGVIGITPKTDSFKLHTPMSDLIGQWSISGVEIFQQRRVLDYRADFLFKSATGSYIVELDGHRYHSSRDDLTRDKVRDRRLQEAGYRVLRFTYDETWPDPWKVAIEVHRIVSADTSDSMGDSL